MVYGLALTMVPFVLAAMVVHLTLWRPAAFGDFRKIKHINARGFVWEYLHSCTGYRPGRSVKRHGKSSSLHSEKIFAWGMRVFYE